LYDALTKFPLKQQAKVGPIEWPLPLFKQPIVFSLPHRLQVVLDSTMEANPSADDTLDSIVEE